MLHCKSKTLKFLVWSEKCKEKNKIEKTSEEKNAEILKDISG